MADKKWINKRTFKGLTSKDLYFRNFRGENKFNPKDDRPTFAIKLDPDLADALDDEGWYIRWSKVRDDAPDDVEPIPYLKITLKFNAKRPPVVNMIIGKTVTELTQDTIVTLDAANIDHMTFKVRPYVWDESGKYGAAAILEGMNIWVKEDDLESELREYMEDDDDDEDEPF